MQEVNFYCEGSLQPKPYSSRTMYVDGTAGKEFREGVDVELSHWRPNRTEDWYKGGTSTEICFNYLALNSTINYDLVVNNHLDVDGVLSVFVLTHPAVALKYKREVIDAAKAGDFWSWAEGKGFKIFQLLSLFFEKCEAATIGLRESYRRCFALILRILQGEMNHLQAEKILHDQYSLITKGKILREELNSRVVSYHVPWSLMQGDVEKFLATPKFNEPISHRLSFWPQVRNRLDEERLQLVSFEMANGIHYELWLPGYCWADTKGLWRPSGMITPEKMGDSSKLQWAELNKIIEDLNTQEDSSRWNLFSGFDFANSENYRDFPIIMTTLGQEDFREPSHIPLNKVKEAFRLLI